MGESRTIAATLAALAAVGCSTSTNSPDEQFLDALRDGGIPVQRVPTGRLTGATPELGHQTCGLFDQDLTAEEAAGRVAATPLATPLTAAQAEKIVYLSVTMLCPEHATALQTTEPPSNQAD